jgi:FkbM family methyltransferase
MTTWGGVRHAAGRLVNRLLHPWGLELVRYHPLRSTPLPRATLGEALAQASRLGCRPRTVVDVGVADGTPELYAAFPQAHHVVVEPLREFEPTLQRICREYDAEYVLAAAGAAPGTATLNVGHDRHVSSLLEHQAAFQRTVPVVTLDEVCSERPGPYVLKVDVQGAELEVIAGAEQFLRQAELVVLETSLFQFYAGGPDLHGVVDAMKRRGFVVYDIVGARCRPLDGALAQVDLVFAPERGALRAVDAYVSPEQERELNRFFARKRA